MSMETIIECPSCMTRMDKHLPANKASRGHDPEPGSFMICGHCGALLIMDDNHQTVIATEDDLEQLKPDDRVMMERVSGLIKHNDRF